MKIFTIILATTFNFLVLFTKICGFYSVSLHDASSFGIHTSFDNRLLNITEEFDIPSEITIRCNLSVETTHQISVQDTCSIRNGTADTTSLDDVIPNEDHCAQYYDFRSLSEEMFWDPHLRECSHPQLFDTTTRSCLHYSLVKCGLRFEPKDACDYMRHQCYGIHCIPCHFRFPSCRGLPDGLNAWPDKLYTPYFVVCVDERVVHRGRCDFHYRLHIFDPEGKACVPEEYIHNKP